MVIYKLTPAWFYLINIILYKMISDFSLDFNFRFYHMFREKPSNHSVVYAMLEGIPL